MSEQDLFGAADAPEDMTRPLAVRMRPQTIDEVVGQDHVLYLVCKGPGKALDQSNLFPNHAIAYHQMSDHISLIGIVVLGKRSDLPSACDHYP